MELNSVREPRPEVTTRSNTVDLVNPDPNTIDMGEIATALSREGRYTNHTTAPWSVAQHLLLCSWIYDFHGYECEGLPQAYARLAVLLHDAHEAYTGDIARPLKRLIQECAGSDIIHDIELGLDVAIMEHLGVFDAYRFLCEDDAAWIGSVVHEVDGLALAAEVRRLHPFACQTWSGLRKGSDGAVYATSKRVDELLAMSPSQVAKAYQDEVADMTAVVMNDYRRILKLLAEGETT